MSCSAWVTRRTNIYIANIVKCRPPQNRDPLQEEQEACMDWLRNQTALLRPKIIVCLGRIAAMRIIKPDFKITREHGQFFKKGNIYMTATLHPAALQGWGNKVTYHARLKSSYYTMQALWR